jgi:hypothetical protein
VQLTCTGARPPLVVGSANDTATSDWVDVAVFTLVGHVIAKAGGGGGVGSVGVLLLQALETTTDSASTTRRFNFNISKTINSIGYCGMNS